MNSVNFNQLLCKDISESGEDITCIFDTLLCESGTNNIHICVIYTQILSNTESSYEKYYYRIVLRRLGNTRDEQKNYRIDSGEFWEDIYGKKGFDIENSQARHRTTRPGYAGKLFIEYEFDIETQGDYEVDLYVKKMEELESHEVCEKLPVKELNLVSICPFQVIFQNN